MDYVGQSAAIGNAPWWSGAYGFNYGRQFADDGSNAVRINRNNEVYKVGLDQLSSQNEETRRVLGEARIMDNINGSCTRVLETQVNGEFRMSDRLRDLEREMAANARTAAECCCDLKLQMCEDKAELKSEILAVESRNIERSLNAANAELTALKTQIACGCCPPAGR